jgi:hypothetical protein
MHAHHAEVVELAPIGVAPAREIAIASTATPAMSLPPTSLSVDSNAAHRDVSARAHSGSRTFWTIAACAVSAITVFVLVGSPALERADLLSTAALDDRETTLAVNPDGQPSDAQPSEATTRDPLVTKPIAVDSTSQPSSKTEPVRMAALTPTVPVLPPATPLPGPKTIPSARSSESDAAELRRAIATAPGPVPVLEASVVTITGCLKTDKDTFKLSDTSGVDAPKSRSWKTGFFKKRPTSVEIVQDGGLNLAGHVGQRVAVTGTLDDRDLRARSFHSVGMCAE